MVSHEVDLFRYHLYHLYLYSESIGVQKGVSSRITQHLYICIYKPIVKGLILLATANWDANSPHGNGLLTLKWMERPKACLLVFLLLFVFTDTDSKAQQWSTKLNSWQATQI